MLTRFVKSAILKKGWAGRTLSREATVAELDSVLQQHLTLQAAYSRAAEGCQDAGQLKELGQIGKRARLDAGKLAETILSCGGCPARESNHGKHHSVPEIADMERAFAEVLRRQRNLEHQMRTRAVLTRLAESSEERLVFIRGMVRALLRKA